MEELQDAIEDAQYMNEITTQEEGPRPVLAWDIPTEEQLVDWKSKVSKSDPDAFSLDWILQSAIGLFLFSSYVKDIRNDYLRINFCEEVIRWKKLGEHERDEKARQIIAAYLNNTHIPSKIEIDEYDLERQTFTVDNLEDLFNENFKSTCENGCIGLDGPLRNDIIKILREPKEVGNYDEEIVDTAIESAVPLEEAKTLLQATKDERKEDKVTECSPDHEVEVKEVLEDSLPGNCSFLPLNFFDKAEAVVMHSIRKEYWTDFLISEHYHKLMNFLWYQDRRVVPEDFFVMRVLGRGGFGSVTGK